MSALPTVGDKRGTRRTLFPLAVMAVAFFIPSYKACLDDPAQSALQFASDGVFQVAWISPVYLVAATLAVLGAMALRSGQVSRAARRLGLASVAFLSAAGVGVGALLTIDNASQWGWLVGPVATSAAAVALVRRARGRAPFQIWEHLLAAFTVLAMGTAPAIFLTTDLFEGAKHLAIGGYLFVAAHLALTAIVGWALVRGRSVKA